jgi:hypothetical protein
VALPIPEITSEDCLTKDEVLESDNQLVAFGMATGFMHPRAALRKGNTVYWVVHKNDQAWCESKFYRGRGSDYRDYGHKLRDLRARAKEIVGEG